MEQILEILNEIDDTLAVPLIMNYQMKKNSVTRKILQKMMLYRHTYPKAL